MIYPVELQRDANIVIETMPHHALSGLGLIGMIQVVAKEPLFFLFALLFVSVETIIAPNVSQNIRLMTWKVCFGFREYLVDLVGKPGHLWEPDSLLNGPSSISISSPLRFPRPKPVEPAVDFRLLAKQYFSDSQSLNLVFDPPSGIP